MSSPHAVRARGARGRAELAGASRGSSNAQHWCVPGVSAALLLCVLLLRLYSARAPKSLPVVCSHRGAGGALSPPPLSRANFLPALRSLAARGIFCFDVDATPGSVYGGSAPAVGHPASLIESARVGTLLPDDVVAPTHAVAALGALLAAGTTATMTLELKGSLATDASLLAELTRAATAAHVLDHFAVIGAARPAASLLRAVSLRDVPDGAGATCGGLGVGKDGAPPRLSHAAFLKRHEGSAVLMPSLECLRQLEVRRGVLAWSLARRLQKGHGRPLDAQVWVWVIDTLRDADEALALGPLGYTRVVSNEGLALVAGGEQ